MESQKAYSTFLKLFEQLSYRHSYGDTFNNFLDFALWMLNPVKNEDTSKAVVRLDEIYTADEGKIMAQLFENWSIAADNDGAGFHDALGDLFQDLVSHGRNGQYFTPQPVCDMMAELVYSGELENGKTVCDCACGSGRMLLAMAKMNRNLKFYGADNDGTCCKMATLNMIVNSMQGEIAQMNSSTVEHDRSWHIRRVLNGSHYMPYYYVTGKNTTSFIQRHRQQLEDSKVIPPKSGEYKADKNGQLLIF